MRGVYLREIRHKMNPRNIIGAQVALARTTQNMSLEGLSKALLEAEIDLTAEELSRIEAQRFPVLDFEIIALARALNASVEWLIIGSDGFQIANKE